jgi:hypothetical protein
MLGDVGQVGLVTGSLNGKLRHSFFHIGGTEGLAPPPRCCRVGIVAVTFGRSRGGQGGGRSTLLLALAWAGVWSRETGAKLTLAPAVIQITGWRARATKADRLFRNARLFDGGEPGQQTGSKRPKTASRNHAESDRERRVNPYE